VIAPNHARSSLDGLFGINERPVGGDEGASSPVASSQSGPSVCVVSRTIFDAQYLAANAERTALLRPEQVRAISRSRSSRCALLARDV
jgi:hypothetical protein